MEERYRISRTGLRRQANRLTRDEVEIQEVSRRHSGAADLAAVGQPVLERPPSAALCARLLSTLSDVASDSRRHPR
jgi:hypothetical protein